MNKPHTSKPFTAYFLLTMYNIQKTYKHLYLLKSLTKINGVDYSISIFACVIENTTVR